MLSQNILGVTTRNEVEMLTVFALWSPVGAVLWRASGPARVASELAVAGRWLLVGRAMYDDAFNQYYSGDSAMLLTGG